MLTHFKTTYKGVLMHAFLDSLSKYLSSVSRYAVKALCDDQQLGSELKNIKDVFVENGYEREKVRKYMETERNRSEKNWWRRMKIIVVSSTYHTYRDFRSSSREKQ